MKRVALAAAVATLAAPASALAAGRALAFNARVLRSDSLSLVLRRSDGRTVTFAANQIAGVPSGASAPGRRAAPIAHAASSLRSAGSAIQNLAPGIAVRVVETIDPLGRATVTLGISAHAGARQHATGVVSAVSGGSFLFDGAGGLELRLRGARAGIHVCERASIVYHQDKLTLVADRVTASGPSDCAA